MVHVPAKEVHKVMKHRASAAAVLPKVYRDYYGINPGSRVTIVYNSLVLIIPESQRELAAEKADLIDELLGQKKPGVHETE